MGSNGIGGNANGELHTEDEALSVLLDGDIDKVMSGLDRIVEAAPSYEKLFARWQRQHWSTRTSTSLRMPASGPTGHVHRGGAQVPDLGFSEFFIAEDRVTVELLPLPLRRRRRRPSSSSRPRSPTRRSTWSSGIASTARCSARR